MNQINVIETLLELGFVEDGSVTGSVFRVGSQASGYRLMEIPDRVRLKLPNTNHKVSIGKRTTCFYQVTNRESSNFQNFKTKDLTEIKDYATKILT